jgi:hypothetical protein
LAAVREGSMLESSAAVVTARPSRQQLEIAGCNLEGLVRVAKILDIRSGDCFSVLQFLIEKRKGQKSTDS